MQNPAHGQHARGDRRHRRPDGGRGGLEYGPAKRRAVKQLGLSARTALPDNDVVEDAVREYISMFCADTQPANWRRCAGWP
jgi:hypothetical protein